MRLKNVSIPLGKRKKNTNVHLRRRIQLIHPARTLLTFSRSCECSDVTRSGSGFSSVLCTRHAFRFFPVDTNDFRILHELKM